MNDAAVNGAPMSDPTTSSTAPLLRISGLSKFYSEIPVLDRVDLSMSMPARSS